MTSDFRTAAIGDLFLEHIETLTRCFDRALEEFGAQGVLIRSGAPRARFLDDSAHPLWVNPHFRWWLPLTNHERCALLVRRGQRPRLFYFQAEDYWYQPAADPAGFWTGAFDIERVNGESQIVDQVTGSEELAYIGEDPALAERCGITTVNPPDLLSSLDFERAYKTAYEMRCLLEANRSGVRGHLAAARAYREGASEFEIQHAFLGAIRQREQETPYGMIVGLDEHAAVLHYQHADSRRPEKGAGRSMLIDAGAGFQGYGSDITRTHAREKGPFQDLIDALEEQQLAIIGEIAPGIPYQELHLKMHRRIAGILVRLGLSRCDEATLVRENLTFSFMPHGLGHLLGLQTHDVGGHQQDRAGTMRPPPAEHPALRITRPVEPGQVFTIEPGIYFIPSLLRELRGSRHGDDFDWNAIDAMRPYGGIRIEDNVCLDGDRVVNLTRESFAMAEAEGDRGGDPGTAHP